MSQPPSPTCNQSVIQEYLDGALSKSAQHSFEEHLTDCESCRKQLHISAVDEHWWEKPAEFLTTDTFDKTLALLPSGDEMSPTLAEDFSQTVSNDSLRRVLELLAPSEDRQMLGRLGRYEIVGAIGFGGMAVVLKGFESTLNRFVAVKVLAPHLASSRSARERFSREARAAASVLHPNVIAIHNVSDFNGLPYLVMPYIAGGSLQDRIDTEGALDTEATVRIGMQIAAGLAAAHKQGLVHRDIKPANILLEPGLERIVITDFGLARAADDASITQTGILAGTPHYMSPEQARGNRVDHRSDLFSLGSLLFTLSSDRVPFESESSYGVLRKITDHDAPKLRDVHLQAPKWLDTLVGRLHQNDPSDRYQSAEVVSNLLSECLASIRDSNKPIPKSLTPPPQSTRNPLLFGVLLILLLGLLYFTASSLLSSRNNHALAVPESNSRQNATPVAWPEDGEWVTFTGRFIMEGELPDIEPEQATRDRDIYDEPIVDESLVVNPENYGIANVFVWLTKDDAEPWPLRTSTDFSKQVDLRYENGRLQPHTVLLNPSQSLRIGNRDPISHNVDLGGIENAKILAGEDLLYELPVRDAPLKISCEYHPWFRCYVAVKDHPFVAITDRDGRFRIENVPCGKWRVRFWHELVRDIEQIVDERGFIQHWNTDEVGYEDGYVLPKEKRGRLIDFDRPKLDLGELVPDLQ